MENDTLARLYGLRALALHGGAVCFENRTSATILPALSAARGVLDPIESGQQLDIFADGYTWRRALGRRP